MRSGDLLVIYCRGEMVLRTYKHTRGRHWLLPLREDASAIELRDGEDVVIWGVVLHVIESTREVGGENEQ